MIDVFLSASVPLPERNRRYFDTADVLAIREAIKALVEIVLPIGRITCGGHPAITPLLALFVCESGLDSNHLTIFQSRYYEDAFPEANKKFQDVRFIEAVDRDEARSLLRMREAMLKSRDFHAGVFIGGMEGVVSEAELFSQFQPNAMRLPIASTGAGAAEVFAQGKYPQFLVTELTYPTLFRRHLIAPTR
jgi:hypothetical protein